MNVEIEDLGSWPSEFKQEAIRNKPLIVSFNRERLNIEQRCMEDVFLRINPPENKFKQSYLKLMAKLEILLTPHQIVVYHCTRLTREEIENIKQEGLQVLSAGLVHKRLHECLSNGYLEQREYEYFMNSQSLSESLDNRHGARSNKICFCANRTVLRDCGAVYRLFRSWGGEAIYREFENNTSIGNKLRLIGVPCIVVCTIPFTRAKIFHPYFSEHFAAYLIASEFEYAEPSAEFDLSVTRNLDASNVLDVIEYSDHRFEHLTHSLSWHTRFQIIANSGDPHKPQESLTI